MLKRSMFKEGFGRKEAIPKWVRLLSILLAVLMATGGMPRTLLAAEPERLLLADGFINVGVNAQNGRFSSGTTGGDPSKPADNDRPVLYEKDIPETSFTSFKIDGEEVIFGNAYLHSSFIQRPQVTGNKCLTIWKYKDVEITQIIELVGNDPDLSAGNAKINYHVHNTSGAPVSIGARVLLDVMTGGNDGPPILKAGEPFPIKGEREFTGDAVPLYWTSVDDFENPAAASYGMLYGWGDAKPSRVVFGHWGGLSSTKWDYEPDVWTNYAVADNRFGSADSAVAVYWDSFSLAANGQREFTTLVGLGDLDQKQVVDDSLAVNITAPAKLLLNAGQNTPFELTAEIDNTLVGSTDRQNLKVEIAYPANCALTSGRQTTSVQTLAKGVRLPVKWTFTPGTVETVNVWEFIVLITLDGKTIKRESAYVVAMPGFSGALPEIEYNAVYPAELYVDEVSRKVSIVGSNFNYLKDDPNNWTVYVKAENGAVTPVNKEDVTVASNNEIQVFLPEGLPLGSYGLGIEHNLSKGFYRESAFRLSNDIRLIRRAYGTLLVTKKSRTVMEAGQEYTYTNNFMYYFAGNSPVTVPDGESEVIRLTGNIQKVSADQYSIIPSPQNSIYLGKLLKVTAESGSAADKKAEIVVDRRDVALTDSWGFPVGGLEAQKQVFVKGNDQCRIFLDVPQLKLGGNPLPVAASKPQVWSKAFELNVNSFTIKSPNLLGLSDETTANIAGYLLGIKELRVVRLEAENQYAVEIKAGLDLGSVLGFVYKYLSTNKKLKYLMYVDVQVENFRIYEDGNVKFKSEFAVGLPQLKIGPLVSSGDSPLSDDQMGSISGKVAIDTIDNVFSISAGLGLPDLSNFGNVGTDKDTTVKLSGKIGVFMIPTGAFPVFLPDTVEAQFKDNYGFISIPQIPFAINQIGGGIYNLHTLRDAANQYPDFNAAFIFGVTDTKTPIIWGKRMLNASDITIAVGSKEMALSGQINIYHIPLTTSETRIMYHPKVGVYASGGIDIAGIIVGKATAELSYHYLLNSFYAGGYVEGYVQIPKQSPIFPGLRLAEAVAGLNTDYVLAYAALPAFGLKAGVKYKWATQAPEFIVAGDIQLPSFSSASALQVSPDQSDPVAAGGMMVGANLYTLQVREQQAQQHPELLPNRLASTQIMGLPLIAAAPPYTRIFSSPGGDTVFVQAKYPKGENIFPITLTDPDGKQYVYPELDETKIIKGEYENNEQEVLDYIAIPIPAVNNVEGDWTIEANLDVDFEAYGMVRTSEIASVAVTPGAETLAYDLDLAFDQAPADGIVSKVDLYLQKPDSDFIATLTTDYTVDCAAGSTLNISLPETIASGEYFITAILKQTDAAGHELQYTKKQSEAFTVENSKNPPAPENITAILAGNGALKVEWDKVDFADITGYYVCAYDDDGSPLPGVTPVWVPYTDGLDRYAVTFGGWTTGQNYQIAVQAVSETKGPEVDNGRYIPADNPKLTGIGGSDRYTAQWKVIPGVTEYVVTLKNGDETINIPYVDDGQSNRAMASDDAGNAIAVIKLPLRNLEPDGSYTLTVNGIREENLLASGVGTADTAAATKTVNWNRVDAANLQSYTIIAKPQNEEEETLVFEYDEIPDPQPAAYSVTLKGFTEGITYDISVAANQKEDGQSQKFYGARSDSVSVWLPAPTPPDFNVSLRPARNDAGNVQVILDATGKPTFLSSTKDVVLNFSSETAVENELFVNANDLSDTGPTETAAGKAWGAELRLADGMNEIKVRAYNAAGDYSERTYQIAVKDTAPTLMLDEPVIQNGQLTITGFTDASNQVYVNSTQAVVDSSGAFTCTLPTDNSMIVDYRVTAVDAYLNENVYVGQVVDPGAASFTRVAIELDPAHSFEEGSTHKLRLYGYNPEGDRIALQEKTVEWSLESGHEYAQLDEDYLHVLKKGECLVKAEYQVNESYTWSDSLLVGLLSRGVSAASYASLQNIMVSDGTLSPAFDPQTLQYSLTVPYSQAAIRLKPAVDVDNPALTVNGDPVENLEYSRQIALNVGANTILVTVESPELLRQTYTLNITRLADNPASDTGGGDGSAQPASSQLPAGITATPSVDGRQTTITVSLPTVIDPVTGAATISLDDQALAAILAKVKEAEDSGQKAILEFQTEAERISGGVTVALSQDVFRQIAATSADIVIATEHAAIRIGAETIDALSASATGESISINIAQADSASLASFQIRSPDQQEPIKGYNVTFTQTVNGQTQSITQPGGAITLQFDLTLEELNGIDPSTLQVVKQAEGEAVTALGGSFDWAQGTLAVSTGHLCTFYVTGRQGIPAQRLAGADRYATAAAISAAGWATADSVILSSGEDFPDALAGTALAGLKNVPILLTSRNTLNAGTLAEIKRLKAKKIYLLGGEGVISRAIEAKLAQDYAVERLAGHDRYETAVQIGQSLGRSHETVILATGRNYPDALSVAPFAGRYGIPILFAEGQTLNETTRKALKDWGAKNVIIAGGAGVLSTKTETELKEGMALSVTRLSGEERYLTSLATAQYFARYEPEGNALANPRTGTNARTKAAALATGEDFPDALAGAVLAAKLKIPILLVQKDRVKQEVKDYLKGLNLEKIYVYGGQGAIRDQAKNEISLK